MSEYGPVEKHGNREYCSASDGTQFTRRIKRDGSHTDWEVVEVQPEPEESPLILMVVLESQAEGEPNHWSLFLAREGETGTVYQVQGDATYMSYTFAYGVDHFNSASYSTSYIAAYLDETQASTVGSCASQEPPPRAENRASVTENCQGWTVRVLRCLQRQGIVTAEIVQSMEAMMEAV